MPIQLRWNNTEKTLLHQIFTESFDLDDWYHSVTEVRIMLNELQHPINIMLDLTALDQLPCDWVNIINRYAPHYHAMQAQQVIVVREYHLKPLQVLLNLGDTSNTIQVVSSKHAAKQLFNINNEKVAVA